MRDFFARMAERALDRARIARPLIGPMFPLEPIVETTGLERAGEPAARTELPVQHPQGGRRPIVPREKLPGALTPEVVDAANAPSSVESSEVAESVESAPLLAGGGAPDSAGIWKETRMQPHREEDEIPVLEPVPTMEAGGPPLHQTVEEVVLEPQVASPVQIQSTAGLTEGTPDMPPSRNTGEVGAHDTPPIVAAGAVHGEAGGEAIQSRSRLDIEDGATSHSGDEPRLHPAHRVDPQALTGAVGPPLSDRDIPVPRPLDLLSPSQGAERRSDPEVRVTIGRVIVKSAREDRPSRQESPARPGPALTLDAYLKDRREGKR